MLKIENTDVFGWEAAIRGARNPMNSWDRMDSHECIGYCIDCECKYGDDPNNCPLCLNEVPGNYLIGSNDMKLMKNLAKAGSDHAKYLRMINVTMDVTAPLYWWKEFDTYKVGTVANSCSTMHKIHSKPFTLDDFSHEHLISSCGKNGDSLEVLESVIAVMNYWRERFIVANKIQEDVEGEFEHKKKMWWQMIQLLPSSYNQKRTVQLNYEVLRNQYHARKNHKLDCWHTYCDWIKTLPYAKELIIGEE